MPKTRIIQFRCTDKQYKLIQNRKEALGYTRLSEFFRDLALKDNLSTQYMLREILKKIEKK